MLNTVLEQGVNLNSVEASSKSRREHVSRKEMGKSQAAEVQCMLEGKLVITAGLINSLTYLLLSWHCVSVDNATSQHHCVSEQVVLGRLPWCWVILLLRDSRASTNTTGHFPPMWHKRKRLKMSVLTLATRWNQYAEPSSVYNAQIKGKSQNSLFPHPIHLSHTQTHYHTEQLAGGWKEWPQSDESE